MHTQSPYYLWDTTISINLPSAFSCHEDKIQSFAGTPKESGDVSLVYQASLVIVPYPSQAPASQIHASSPSGARFCLDAQDVTMSNKVLVVSGMMVWGGWQYSQ